MADTGKEGRPAMLMHKELLAEQLKDPSFRKAWEESEPAYQLKRLRILKKISQEQLAAKVGTRQPSIARLENGEGLKNLTFVRRIAEALDADVVIHVVPRTLSESMAAKYLRPKRKNRKKAIART
jgi:transcriptional regulator with XRE-family HTH domain